MDGFLYQKQEASRESLSVASQERPKEAGVEVSEEFTLYNALQGGEGALA